MITHKKRKNSDKFYIPYLIAVMLFLSIGAFMTMDMKVADDNKPIQTIQDNYALPDDVDVSGEWIGFMTEDYGDEVRYDYRLVLEQSGDTIKGISYQESTNRTNEIYAESSLRGDVEGNELYFYEATTDVLDNLSLDRWCRIEVRLDYEVIDGQETLIGTWDSAEEERSGCITIDGRAILSRQSD